MTRTDFYVSITNTYKEAYEIIQKKTMDYAADDDALKNINYIENLTSGGISRNAGIYIRLSDKFARLGNLLFSDKEKVPANESIDDTLLDIINYCAILRAARQESDKYTNVEPIHS